MPNITPLELDEVGGDVREHLERLAERTGYVSQAQLTLAHRPQVMHAVAALQQAVGGSATVPRSTMFLVAEMASKVAGCRHCQSHVAKNLHQQGVELDKIRAIWDYENSDLFDERERAALDLAAAAAQVPSMATAEHFERLREVGYSEAELVDIMAMISLFGFMNRWNDGVATRTEDAPARFALEHLGDLDFDLDKHRGDG